MHQIDVMFCAAVVCFRRGRHRVYKLMNGFAR